MGDRTRGLYNKFIVERTDGKSAPGQKHDGCDYFVLDVTHDPFAPNAIRAYALACESEYPLLAHDLRERFPEPSPLEAATAALRERAERAEGENITLEGEAEGDVYFVNELKKQIAALMERAEKAEKSAQAWEEDANRYCRNELFYMGLLDDVAKHLGPEVYVSDDGSVQQDPIRLKIPEMVGELAQQLSALTAERDALKADQGDWRKGVELIAAGLGEMNPPNLSCVRIYELALAKSVEIETLTQQVAALTKELDKADAAISKEGKMAYGAGYNYGYSNGVQDGRKN